MNKDFWPKSKIAVVGGGSWGTVLAHLASQNCTEVSIWVRSEEQARLANSTRSNQKYLPDLELKPNVKFCSEFSRVFENEPEAVVWALPSKAYREVAKEVAPSLKGHEFIYHATKGIEEGSLKRISSVLAEELPCPRIGVLSGPNLAKEVARSEPAATVIASSFDEVVSAGRAIFQGDSFLVYGASDVVGVEWAGTLKNILAIASGSLDAMGLGWNSRSLLISRGLAEFVRFGKAMGGKEETFLGLAGVGDLLATCSSSLSRNYRVGYQLAKGKPLNEILSSLGQTAEGVRTVRSVRHFAQERGIPMPITEAVYHLVGGEMSVTEALHFLMTHPQIE